MALTWNDLFQSGSIVNLQTKLWRARLQITPEDLGIEDTEAVNKALSLGVHRLAPSEAFEKVHAAARKAERAIERHSLRFNLIYGARYVPERNFDRLKEELAAARIEFDDAVAAFIDNYEQMKTATLPLIFQALKDACDNEEVAAAAHQRIRAEYPTAAQVRFKFLLTWQVYSISGPSSAAAGVALKEETESVRGIVTDMVKQLRDEVTEKLQGVLALIAKGGKLQERSIKSAFQVLDHIDRVNVLGDQLLTQQVSKLRAALRGIDVEQDVSADTVQGLDDIKRTLEGNIEDAVKAAEQKLSGLGRRKLVAV